MSLKRYRFILANSFFTMIITILCLAGTLSRRDDLTDEDGYKTIRVEKEKASERDKFLLDFHRKNINKTRIKRLPNIIGIGEEKCGTGWLQFALKHHPMIKVQLNEARFFNNRDYLKGIGYYRNLMAKVTENELVMEKSPGYFNLGSRKTPERIKSELPKAKLLLVLCDPVQRTFSDFVHEQELKHTRFRGTFEDYVDKYVPATVLRFRGVTEKNFDNAVASWNFIDKDSHILTAGIYYYSLKRWYAYFSPKQLLIISGEELLQDSGKVIEEVQDFLGIPEAITREDFVKNPDTGLYCIVPSVVVGSKVKRKSMNCYTSTAKGVAKGRTRSNSTSYHPNPQKLKILRSFFKPYDKMLFNLLGRKLW